MNRTRGTGTIHIHAHTCGRPLVLTVDEDGRPSSVGVDHGQGGQNDRDNRGAVDHVGVGNTVSMMAAMED